MASDAATTNLTHQVLRLADAINRQVGLMEAAELRAREQDKARQTITVTATAKQTNAVADWRQAVAEQRTVLGFTDWLEEVTSVDNTTSG